MRTDFNKSIERGGRTTITKDVGVESERKVTKKRERKKERTGQKRWIEDKERKDRSIEKGGSRRSNKWSKEFERNKGRGK